MQKNNAESKTESKENINTKKSVDKNLEILHERLSQTKAGFDYKITPDKKIRLTYNSHELKVDIKSGEDLVETAKLIKTILDDYKKR
jgi:hypothetical protein